MNRLAFGEFHQKHFGSQQKAYWQSILYNQQQNVQTDPNVDPNQAGYYDSNQQYVEYPETQYEPDANYTEYQQSYYEQQYSDNQQYDMEYQEGLGGLSKEAIEIFKFSEAYRKEKQLEKQKEEEQDLEGMAIWEYDESNVHCSGGMEAPATSLVLLKPESERPPKNSKLRIQEELLNSMYLSSCQNEEDSTPVVLWPVLPFKM